MEFASAFEQVLSTTVVTKRRTVMSFDSGGVILAPGHGRVVGVPGHPYTYKARGENTRGAYSLVEVTITGQGPPQHIHGAEEEAFYVLEGSVNIQLGEEIIQGRPGSFVLIPRGTVHTFWNAGVSPGKLLVIVSPPGMEDYLAEVIDDQEIDTATFVAKVTEVADKYHMKIVGPPLG
jgi:mannose-6-phosphate isomerase-like protein (cupin superfamily)